MNKIKNTLLTITSILLICNIVSAKKIKVNSIEALKKEVDKGSKGDTILLQNNT